MPYLGNFSNYLRSGYRAKLIFNFRMFSTSKPINPNEDEAVTYERLAGHLEYCKTCQPDANIVIVDVRPPEEIKEFGGMIPNSINLPRKSCKAILIQCNLDINLVDTMERALSQMNSEEFQSRFGQEKPERDRDCLLFYCKMGGRAKLALDLAKALGYKAIYYPGGWLDWQEQCKNLGKIVKQISVK